MFSSLLGGEGGLSLTKGSANFSSAAPARMFGSQDVNILIVNI
jgi:hypothetical protein